MLVTERSVSAERMMSEVDGMVIGMDRPEMIGVRHAAYRAVAIAIMKNRDARKMTYNSYREEPGRRGRTYRVGERFEAQPLHVKGYALGQHAVTVGMARNTTITLPSRIRRAQGPVVTREEFYIRDFQKYTSGEEPDISVEKWAIPRGDVRLPSADVAAEDIYEDDMLQFGREIFRLAAAEGVELPRTAEEIRAVGLAAVPLD